VDPVADLALARLVARVKHDPEVVAVLLFGSLRRGAMATEPSSDLATAHTRLDCLPEADLDLVPFSTPPGTIGSRVLNDGVVLVVRDEEALYALAIRTARAFETLQRRLGDLDAFRREILEFLRKPSPPRQVDARTGQRTGPVGSQPG
jgi:hypothetical protein